MTFSEKDSAPMVRLGEIQAVMLRGYVSQGGEKADVRTVWVPGKVCRAERVEGGTRVLWYGARMAMRGEMAKSSLWPIAYGWRVISVAFEGLFGSVLLLDGWVLCPCLQLSTFEARGC
jgi:hypothetical protein